MSKNTNNRSKRKLIAEETLQIMAAGSYTNSQGQTVSLADELESAKQGTQLIRPSDFAALKIPNGSFSTRVDVRNETSFAGAQDLLTSGAENVCVLNFASAKKPGGGFLGGSQAQEEALARASGLYGCLQMAMPYYEFHRSGGTALYSHHMIYSPQVPVFRDDADQLLDEIWLTSMITSPAVNAGALQKNRPDLDDEIEPVMAERIELVLKLAAANGQRNLVLGAWGCGVFRNDPRVIARLFMEALTAPKFNGVFERVRFSVLDHTPGLVTFRAFQDAVEPEVVSEP